MATKARAAAFAGSTVLVIMAGVLEVGGVPRASHWGIRLGMTAMWELAAGAVWVRHRRFRSDYPPWTRGLERSSGPMAEGIA